MDQEIDIDFQDAFGVQIHQYLTTLLQMKDPLLELHSNKELLASQWNRISRTKDGLIGSGQGFYLVENRHILEHCLDEELVVRLDLASFVSQMFATSPDTRRLQKALQGYAKYFQPTSNETDKDREAFRTTFSQLVVLILASNATSGNKTSDVLTHEIRETCTKAELPEPDHFLDENKPGLMDLVRRVSNNKKALMGLYGNTLKMVMRQLDTRLQGLGPITDNLAKDVLEDTQGSKPRRPKESRVAQVSYDKEIYSNVQKWLEAEMARDADKQGGEKEGGLSKQDTNVAVKPPAVAKEHRAKHKARSRHLQEVQHKEAVEDVARVQSKAKGKQRHVSPSPDHAEYDDHQQGADNSSDSDAVPERIITAKAPSRADSGSTSKVPEVLTLPRARFGRIVKRAKKAVSKKIDSDSSFEEGNEELPQTPVKKRDRRIDDDGDAYLTDPEDESIHDTASNHSEDRIRAAITTARPVSEVTSRGASREPAVKGRKRNRPWSEAEVHQLMQLVPMFQHEPDEVAKKKRIVKWSKLKKYDEEHGNFLQHRDQVMLKDKYREQTDNGRHRKYVQGLLRAKNADQRTARTN